MPEKKTYAGGETNILTKKRIMAFMLAVLTAAFIVWRRQAIGTLFSLLTLSATIGYLISPLSRLCEKRFSKKRGPLIAFASAMLLLVACMYALAPVIIRQAATLAEQLPNIWRQALTHIDGFWQKLIDMGIPEDTINNAVEELSAVAADIAGGTMESLSAFARGVAGAGWILLSPMLAYYLTRDRDKVFELLERLVPSRFRHVMKRIGGSAREALGQFVRGQVIVALITGAMTAVGLMLCGVPSSVLLGIIMAVFDLIPYFGPVIGSVPILLVAGGQGLTQLIKALVVVVAAQQLETLLIHPRVMSNSSKLHPALVMTSVFAGGLFAGLAGMVFALPILLIGRVIIDTLINIKLYGDVK